MASEERSAIPNSGSSVHQGVLHRSASLLTPSEYQLLNQIACGDRRYARRARALVALHTGATQGEAGECAGLTDRRVRYWLAQFREKRTGIFPEVIRTTVVAVSDAVSEHDVVAGDGAVMALRASNTAAAQPGSVTSGQPIYVPNASDSAPALYPEVLTSIGPDDTMTEAARKTLQYYLCAMLAHEPGTRLGEDPEELHKMRVATRRMRAAVQVFHAYVNKQLLAPYLNGMRRTAKVLGRVRDLDVGIGKAIAFTKSKSGRGADLRPLLSAWRDAHQVARVALLTYLDSPAYQRFKEDFAVLLETPLAVPDRLGHLDAVVPTRLRHVVPIEIYARLAEVRAFDAVIGGEDVALEHYHNLRIACKRLRYTLEFFEHILGPEVKEAIGELKEMQDYLGDFQDAVVASDRLRNFWLWGTWDAPAKAQMGKRRVRSILAPGVARYHTEKQLEIEAALQGFAKVWTQYQEPDFCRLIARAVSIL